MWLSQPLEKFKGGLLHLISHYTVIQHLRICSWMKTCGLSGDVELYLWWLHSHIQIPIWCYSHQVMSKIVWKKHCSLSWHQILFLLFRTKQMSCLADWAVSHVSMRYGEIMMIPAFCLPFISPWFHIEKLQAKAVWQLLHPNSTQHYSYISSSTYIFCSLSFSQKPVNCCDSFRFSFFFHPIFLSFREMEGGVSFVKEDYLLSILLRTVPNQYVFHIFRAVYDKVQGKGQFSSLKHAAFYMQRKTIEKMLMERKNRCIILVGITKVPDF